MELFVVIALAVLVAFVIRAKISSQDSAKPTKIFSEDRHRSKEPVKVTSRSSGASNSAQRKGKVIHLRDVEPFNIPPADNEAAFKFTSHLTGSESFEFDGMQPRSMIIYSVKYNYPRHCLADAWLLSVGVDEFTRICERTSEPTMEQILKDFVVGSIHIEYGGACNGVMISSKKLSLNS